MDGKGLVSGSDLFSLNYCLKILKARKAFNLLVLEISLLPHTLSVRALILEKPNLV